MYHAGWAWAGGTPFQGTKLIASHFGGTRNPMVISWPSAIKPDKTPRTQFHHVNDIVPTIYDILGIKPPKVVDGFKQDPIDGVSMAYTFADATAPGRKTTQYFDNNGSRGIYQDGWFAGTFGPLMPWDTVSSAATHTWDANKDVWELYDLRNDFSQANDLAAKNPKKLAEMKALFLKEAQGEQGVSRSAPASGCACIRRIGSRRPTRAGNSMPSTTAHAGVHRAGSRPGKQPRDHRRRIRRERAAACSMRWAAFSGGLTLFMDKGELVYEYNMMMIERYFGPRAARSAAGKHKIEIDTTIARPGAAAEVVLVGRRQGSRTNHGETDCARPHSRQASPSMSASISARRYRPDYFDRRPFRFDGQIERVEVKLK